jgi:hypothetical protein
MELKITGMIIMNLGIFGKKIMNFGEVEIFLKIHETIQIEKKFPDWLEGAHGYNLGTRDVLCANGRH